MNSDAFIHHEESDFFNTRKDSRQERKRATRLDRSKYKKSDQNKRKSTGAPAESATCKRGLVLSIRPQQFLVDCQGEQVICSLRGSLKKDSSKLKNLVIVGDYVHFEEMGSNSGVIVSIETRKSVLSRADHLSQQKEHLIAANVDQVIICVSALDPPLRPSIIDRYLIAAAKGRLHPIVVCNKIDLLQDPAYTQEEREAAALDLAACQKVYTDIGVDFLQISAQTGEGLASLAEKMNGRISVFSGQSGTGKSSLINAITGRELKVGKTVSKTRKGSHTTSFAQLLTIAGGGWCIDTPGIKSFGVWDLKEEDIRTFFVEIHQEAGRCRFPDCRHRGEPDCSVERAVEEGRIAPFRYVSYLSLLEEIKTDHLRR